MKVHSVVIPANAGIHERVRPPRAADGLLASLVSRPFGARVRRGCRNDGVHCYSSPCPLLWEEGEIQEVNPPSIATQPSAFPLAEGGLQGGVLALA